MYFDVLDPSSITKFLASKHVGQSVNPKELIHEWPFVDSETKPRRTYCSCSATIRKMQTSR